jgi:hypothetical protein
MSISAQPYRIGSTPLKDSFFEAMGVQEHDSIHVKSLHDSDMIDAGTNEGETSVCEYAPGQRNGIIRKISLIEDLIKANDFKGAAEEILKLNIADIPQNLFDRYTEALETTAENLSLKSTYLNAQLASQSLVVVSIQDELQQNGILFTLNDVDDDFTMGDLNLGALGADADLMSTLVWLHSDGVGDSPADEHNPQFSPNTAVLARFMKQQTEGDRKQASYDHGGQHAAHVYNLDMKLGL